MKQATHVFLIFCILNLIPAFLFGSGLDLTVLHGSRHVKLGGQQIVLATDAYAPFYNPAGLAWLEGGTSVIGTSPLFLQYGAPIGANNAQRSGPWTIGPLFYAGAAYRFNDRIGGGIAVYPTALQGGKISDVDYSSTLQDKPMESRLARIELAPTVSVKLSEYFSAGLSYRVGYTKAESFGGLFEAPGVVPGVLFRTKVSGWDGKGLKLGVQMADWNRLSAAITYRFRTDLSLDGSTSVNEAVSFPSKQHAKIPAQLQVGSSYEIVEDKWLVVATYEFTQNSVIKDFTTVAPGIGAVLGTGNDQLRTPVKFRDGHTIHIGVENTYRLTGDRVIRPGLGFAYDHAVTRNDYPNPVLAPAAPYYGYSIGANYEWARSVLGLALNYGQYSRRSSSISGDITPQTVFTGKYSLKAFLASLDYQWRF